MFEHRDAFMGALRAGPDMRKRVFDSLEERFAQDLATGRAGKVLYDSLYSAVRDADVPGAAKEFEDRFLPLVNPRRSPRQTDVVDQDRIAAVAGRTGQRSWIPALCAVAIVVGALALGLIFLNGVVAKPPTRAKPFNAHTQDAGPAAEAPKPATPTQVIGDVPDPPSEH